jgi:hypothetical protein
MRLNPPRVICQAIAKHTGDYVSMREHIADQAAIDPRMTHSPKITVVLSGAVLRLISMLRVKVDGVGLILWFIIFKH